MGGASAAIVTSDKMPAPENKAFIASGPNTVSKYRADLWMDRWMENGWVDEWMEDERVNGWMDRWMDGWKMDGWIIGWMDECRMDGQMEG
jgi:hypothetical protein